MRRMPIGSSPVSGSSNSSVVASRTSPQAITTFCRMPRDSSPGSDRSLPVSSSSSSSARGAAVEVVHAVQARDEPQVLLDRQVLEQVRLVGHEREAPLRLERVLDDVVAVDRDAAGRRPQDAGQRPQRRRLAGAVRADQADDLAARRR